MGDRLGGERRFLRQAAETVLNLVLLRIDRLHADVHLFSDRLGFETPREVELGKLAVAIRKLTQQLARGVAALVFERVIFGTRLVRLPL